jgi:pimeloyl-ACP methyl ester carboxylesterase
MTTDTSPVVALDNVPVFFPPEDGTYFGIITRPATGAAKTGVVLLSGTQFGTTTVGKNRMFVELAARLAAEGYGSIRFDYQGVGEALEGVVDYRLEEPATPAMRAAVDAMRAAGFERILVTGTCFGSRTALVGTAEDPAVAGLFLVVPPVRDMIKGEGGSTHLALHRNTLSLVGEAVKPSTLRRHGIRKVFTVGRTVIRSKWRLLKRRLRGGGREGADTPPELAGVSPRFLQPLRQLVERGTPVHIMWGTEDFLYREFLDGTEGKLGQILARAGDQIDQVVVDGKVRGFGTVPIQQRVIEETVAWAGRFPK